jgi:signal transduction histidine kinase
LILLSAILAGGLVGFFYARWQKRSWSIPSFRYVWLIFIAFLPQFFAFYLPASRTWYSDSLAALSLVSSQILLLVFCWLNRHLAGIWILALGTALNLIVIAANGGFMPISPETASHLVSQETLQTIPEGGRFGYGKDILLLPENTSLVWLSDRFLLPEWSPYQVAFSGGDLLIALGAFWLMVTQGQSLKAMQKKSGKENHR